MLNYILMCVPCILYSLLSRPTNAQHTYAVTFYISSVLHVSMYPHHLQAVLSIYFAKVIKIIKVTNSLNSLDYNAYMIPMLVFPVCLHTFSLLYSSSPSGLHQPASERYHCKHQRTEI